MDTISDPDHPIAWYDDAYAGTWWAQGHVSLAELAALALEYDSAGFEEDEDGRSVQHLWRSDCGTDGHFDTGPQGPDYPHAVTRLI